MKLVVLGYGNMAKAILAGILKKTKTQLGIVEIIITGRAPQKLESWLSDFFTHNKSDFVNDITMIPMREIDCEGANLLLACKPYNLSEFSFAGYANITYSVLAGIDVQALQKHIDSKHYVLIMPNVAASYALSSNAVLWNPNSEIKQEQKEKLQSEITDFISSFGNCVFVGNQNELHASIATNGSAPAVLALIAQGLINAGVHQGLRPDVSKELVQKTFEGIARMLKDKSPQEIKDSVTSPGGTTAEALLYCDENALQGVLTRACIKAVEKAKGMQK